jgi:hypothetical protein
MNWTSEEPGVSGSGTPDFYSLQGVHTSSGLHLNSVNVFMAWHIIKHFPVEGINVKIFLIQWLLLCCDSAAVAIGTKYVDSSELPVLWIPAVVNFCWYSKVFLSVTAPSPHRCSHELCTVHLVIIYFQSACTPRCNIAITKSLSEASL